MYNGDVISMPDKWEYPWYAAWDLAFHVLPLTLVDPDFGKQQLKLMLRERYMHPNGQIPAYEWNFGDVNPPVHAWATIFTYRLEKAQRGEGDKEWLKSCFQKLLLNFTWWVNRKDRSGRNVFEGGFLGLDNIGVFDRSAPLADRRLSGAGRRHRLDGPLLPEHAGDRRRAGADRSRLRGHGAEVRRALPVDRLGDGARRPGHGHVGRGGRLLLRRAPAAQRPGPAAQGAVDGRAVAAVRRHGLRRRTAGKESRNRRAAAMVPGVPPRAARRDSRPAASRASAGRRLASILDETRLRRVLAKMLDENEFLSEFGLRSLSRYHADHPYVIHAGGQEYRVSYLPAESDTRHVRRQLELARPDLDAGQRPRDPGAAAVLHATTATTSRSNAPPAPAGR